MAYTFRMRSVPMRIDSNIPKIDCPSFLGGPDKRTRLHRKGLQKRGIKTIDSLLSFEQGNGDVDRFRQIDAVAFPFMFQYGLHAYRLRVSTPQASFARMVSIKSISIIRIKRVQKGFFRTAN